MSTTLTNPAVSAQIGADVAAGTLSGAVLQRSAPTLGTGTPSGSVNLVVTKDLVVNTSTPQTFDLTSIADPAGNVVTFGHLVAWQFSSQTTTTGQNFTVGGGTNAIVPASQPITAGGHLQQACPEGVTVDGTHKIVAVSVASGTAVAGRLTLLGRTS